MATDEDYAKLKELEEQAEKLRGTETETETNFIRGDLNE
jgi:hypothetical protein